jgi:hypothetical protein
MIETKTRTVFLSTLKGRHYLTKSGAVKAEARALIEAKHPTERPEFDGNGYMTDQGWHWSMMDRSNVLLRRVCRLVRNGPNVEFSGDAPPFGAASAGTQGYASVGGKDES